MRARGPLEGLQSPPAPDELKQKVLLAARRARAARSEPTLEERLWSSWGLRLGWLASVAALLILNFMLPEQPTPAGRAPEIFASQKVADVDALPGQPARTPGGDRTAVLCELQIDCGEVEPERSRKGDRT